MRIPPVDRLRLDASTGKLYWVKPPRNHPRLLGQEAGAPRRDGCKTYWVVKLDRIAWKRGVLVFYITHGRLPNPCLDHISGDSLNDHPSNLREATKQQNSWNIKSKARLHAFPMGVRKMGPRFQARITKDGTQHHLGCFETVDAARAAYLAKRQEFFGEFA